MCVTPSQLSYLAFSDCIRRDKNVETFTKYHFDGIHASCLEICRHVLFQFGILNRASEWHAGFIIVVQDDLGTPKSES